MKYTCFIIGTTLIHRVDKLIETMVSIDNQNFNFESKILSIDNFGEGLDDKLKEHTDNNGWLVIMGDANGMVNNQIRALNNVDTEWVLYCEDDVLIQKLPTKEQLQKLHNEIDNVCLVSLTGGGYNLDHKVLDNITNPDNHIIVGIDETFWFRDPNFNNGWFFEFPALFIKKDVFKACIDKSLSNFKNQQIEQAYTKSYFNLGYHEKCRRYTWVRDINNHLDFNKPIIDLLGDICNNLVFIRHNRNNHSPHVGSGYHI
jgi:hypothetical protein